MVFQKTMLCTVYFHSPALIRFCARHQYSKQSRRNTTGQGLWATGAPAAPPPPPPPSHACCQVSPPTSRSFIGSSEPLDNLSAGLHLDCGPRLGGHYQRACLNRRPNGPGLSLLCVQGLDAGSPHYNHPDTFLATQSFLTFSFAQAP